LLLPDSLDGFPPCRMLSTMLDEVCTHFFCPPRSHSFLFSSWRPQRASVLLPLAYLHSGDLHPHVQRTNTTTLVQRVHRPAPLLSHYPPLIVHVSSLAMLRDKVLPEGYVMPEVYWRLMLAFWPGPLILLFPAQMFIRQSNASHAFHKYDREG